MGDRQGISIAGIDVGGTFTDLVLVDGATGAVSLAKVASTLDNQAFGVLAALKEAGTGPSNTARLNIFVTDVDAFLAMAGDATGAIKADGTETAGTLIGVARLFDPDVMIELEATAVA